jgi:hypothetical protein
MLYNTKSKFICQICGSVKLSCESFPYCGVIICAQCHESILYKETDERIVRQCDLIKQKGGEENV